MAFSAAGLDESQDSPVEIGAITEDSFLLSFPPVVCLHPGCPGSGNCAELQGLARYFVLAPGQRLSREASFRALETIIVDAFQCSVSTLRFASYRNSMSL